MDDIEWARIADICDKPVLFDMIAANEIDQGALGDCWLLAAIAMVAEYPGHLLRLFKQHKAADDGRQRASVGKFRQNVARFRLYRLRFLQENMRFATFFEIYQILKLKFLKFDKILQILRHMQFFAEISRKLLIFQTDFLRKF